jgi:Glyoxalase-like domain
MSIGFQVTFDAADPQRLAAFWRDVLGYRDEDPPEPHATWEEFARAAGIPEERWGDFAAVVDPDGVRPRLFFQRVPEPKTAKNRVHLDVKVGGDRGVAPERRRELVDDAVERVVGAGATRVRAYDEPDQYWVVMRDPEGNEFCLY